MADVYSGAKCVLIWLGLAPKNAAIAFAIIHASAEYDRRKFAEPFFYVPEISYRESFVENELTEHPQCACCGEMFEGVLDNNWDTIASLGIFTVLSLLDRPWFSRLWVLQEIYAARYPLGDVSTNTILLYCGNHVTSWQDYYDLFMHVHQFRASRLDKVNLERLDREKVHRIMEVLQFKFRRAEDKLFNSRLALQMQLACAAHVCSDPRDRIFALRRLLGAEAIDDLRPDYSLPTSEVYRRFVVACLQHRVVVSSIIEQNSVSWVFALVGTEMEPVVDRSWPSWVPNFNSLTQRSRFKQVQYAKLSETQFNSDLKLFEYAIERTKHKELRVKGRIFASIEKTLEASAWYGDMLDGPRTPLLRDTSRIESMATFVEWYFLCKAFAEEYASHPRLRECFVKLVLHGFWCLSPVTTTQMLSEIEALREVMGSALTEMYQLSDLVSAVETFVYAERSRSSLNTGRMLCHLVGDGFEDVAWVPKTARVGDNLCIFAGQPYPFLLRGRDRGRFTMLGDAFLATTSLLQALGASGEAAMRDVDLERWSDPAMNWATEDEEMRKLIDGLGWITLR